MPSFLLCLFFLLPGFAMAAPFEFDALEYGAKGDNDSDDTEAIQKALNAAGEVGGARVLLPAGTYRLEGSLRIPPGVTLQGIWTGAHHEDRTWGTALFVYGGRGEATGTATINLSPGAAVRGLTVFYPEQKPLGIVPYPYAIRGEGMELTVENVTLANAYQGIDFSPVHELHTIRNVRGCVLKQGILIDRCTDIGRIENVHFNPHIWLRSLPAPGAENYTGADWQGAVDYINQNLDVFIFARSDWEYVFNTFAWGFKTCYKFVERGDGGCNGNFLGIGADGGQYCLWVEKTQPPGLLITNGEFVAFTGDKPTSIVTAPDFTGLVQLNNCSFWGPAHQCVLQQGNGVVSLNQCHFQHWGFKGDETVPAVECISGDLTVTGCLFAMNRPAIRVAEEAGPAIVSGNRYRGEKRVEILNEGKAKKEKYVTD